MKRLLQSGKQNVKSVLRNTTPHTRGTTTPWVASSSSSSSTTTQEMMKRTTMKVGGSIEQQGLATYQTTTLARSTEKKQQGGTAPNIQKEDLPFEADVIKEGEFEEAPDATGADEDMVDEDWDIDDEGMNAEEKEQEEGEIIQETETVAGDSEALEFQAETKQLLSIVATALYTDKDVFIRELISNASDALEKTRQAQLQSDKHVIQDDLPLEIRISVDEKNHVFTIQDTGIGMTRDELVNNIGMIARSGSKQFIQQLKEAGSTDTSNIIGQFGVGFYSSFMVSDGVKLYSRSAIEDEHDDGHCWVSGGGSSFKIAKASGVQRGTKIIVQLKEEEKEYAMKDTVERIIKKYSNFVQYPIYLNGSKVSTLDAIWLRGKNDIKEEEHKEFFQYMSRTGGEPLYRIQFHTDVPLSIYSLFYIPKEPVDDISGATPDPDINVYSKKVLIKAKHRGILPSWLRFMKGAVDSEDLPLNISREHLQNSPLIRRINGILTRKILSFLTSALKENPDKYAKFYARYHVYLKEGILNDYLYKDELSSLLLFHTSHANNEPITLDKYVSRMKPDQKEIYYLMAPNYNLALSSPYYEQFKARDLEVIFIKHPRDEACLQTIMSYEGKALRAAETVSDLPPIDQDQDVRTLTKLESNDLGEFITQHVENAVDVETTTQLTGTPAVIKNPENSIERFFRRQQNQDEPLAIQPQTLLVDPRHPLIVSLYDLKQSDPTTAKLAANQLFDNALVAAGLIDDARYMLPRLQSMLHHLVVSQAKQNDDDTSKEESL